MSRDWQTVLDDHQRMIAALAAQAGLIEELIDVVAGCLRRIARVYTGITASSSTAWRSRPWP